jgi:colicin import membrane protein
MTAATLRPPEAAGLGRGFGLALLAHALLLAGLSYSVNWRSAPSPAFEAELWSAVPQVAAPREEAPPEPEPKPEPKPDPRAQARAAEEEAAEQREAEIAIAKARKVKEEKEARLLKDKLAKEKAAKDEAERERERAEKDKAAKDKAAKALADAKQAKEADAKREAQRLENLRRIQGMAGATGAAGATGSAAQNAAPSAGYPGRIKAAIRPMIIFAVEATNPEAEVRITLAPDGRILGAKVLKASPDPDWDRAVLRGIEKAERVPRDIDGRVPAYIDLLLRPRE